MGKALDDITRSDIERLLTAKVEEGRNIEYKLALPGDTDKEKKEFLADVSPPVVQLLGPMDGSDGVNLCPFCEHLQSNEVNRLERHAPKDFNSISTYDLPLPPEVHISIPNQKHIGFGRALLLTDILEEQAERFLTISDRVKTERYKDIPSVRGTGHISGLQPNNRQ